MKRSIRLLCLFLCTQPLYASAQIRTIYFNKSWKKTSKNEAAYYRTVTELPEHKYKIEDHYMDGRLQMIGYATSIANIEDGSDTDTSLNGQFIYYDSSSARNEGIYKKGKKTGEWKRYDHVGRMSAIETFEEGTPDGLCMYYDTLGKYKHKGNFTKGRMTGEWTYYYPYTDKAAAILNFLYNDQEGTVTTFDTSGHILVKGAFADNKKSGSWIAYYPGSNRIWMAATFKSDVADGDVNVYYKNGRKMITMVYKEGDKLSEKYYDESGLPLEKPDMKMQLAVDKALTDLRKSTLPLTE